MKDWRVVNGLFVATTILQGLSFGHTMAYLPLYLGTELGMAPAEVSSWTGILYAAMMGIAFPLAPFWGALAERYSRRLVIVRSQYIEAASHLLLVFAPDLWWVVGVSAPAWLHLRQHRGRHRDAGPADAAQARRDGDRDRPGGDADRGEHRTAGRRLS